MDGGPPSHCEGACLAQELVISGEGTLSDPQPVCLSLVLLSITACGVMRKEL